MATLRPSLSEIITRIEDDARARLSAEELRRSDISVFIRVLAGVSHSLYGAIEYGRRQLFSDTADTSFLERMAGIYGLSRNQAARSTGKVKFTWNAATDIPTGTIVQTAEGLQFSTTSSPDSDGVASAQAVEAGASGNIESGVSLTLASAIAGVTGAVTETAMEGGADEETDAELRARVLARTINPPRTGTASDYVAWAKEISGVGDVWVYPKEQGDGTVTVRFLTTSRGLPDDALLEKVRERIKSKASILADVYVVAPVFEPVNFTISVTPDTIAVRTAVQSAIEKVFEEESSPGASIYLSHFNAAISAAAGEEDHAISSPAGNIAASDTFHMPVLGSITWKD
jgi:uncharacterized phage protein gp47/JayE